MRQVSKKQSKINATLSKIKSNLPKRCYLCGCNGSDLAHILPRGQFPQYITEDWNLIILCRYCHNKFDGNREFRKSCNNLFNRVIGKVREEDKGLVSNYFDIWNK